MKKKNNVPMLEEEKQTTPMPGEIDPKDAYIKAREFASKEKASLKRKK
jgi:hypothetical protein